MEIISIGFWRLSIFILRRKGHPVLPGFPQWFSLNRLMNSTSKLIQFPQTPILTIICPKIMIKGSIEYCTPCNQNDDHIGLKVIICPCKFIGMNRHKTFKFQFRPNNTVYTSNVSPFFIE